MSFLISKQAIRDFLSRKLEDYRWLKSVTKEELQAEIRNITDYKSPSPYEHTHPQLVGLLIGLVLPGFLFYYDMGRGKTRMALDIAAARKHMGEVEGKILVLVDTNTNVENWELQVPEHSKLSVLPLLDGTIAGRFEMLKGSKANVAIMTYMSLLHMVGVKVKSKKKEGNQFKIEQKKVKAFAKMFGLVIMDEVHKVKNKDSKFFKACKSIGKFIPYRYGLSGTPMHQPLDLWAQFFLVDSGETFGSGITVFKQSFYVAKDKFFGTEWNFDKKKQPALTKLMQNRSLEYLDEEDQDLPQKVEQIIPVQIGEQAKHYYDMVVRGVIDAKKGDEQEKIKGTFMKMRQLASGFLYYEGQTLEFEKTKLDALQMVLSGTQGRKVIVFYDFVESGKVLEAFCKKEHIPYAHIGSKKSKGKDKGESAYKIFLSDPKKQVCLASLSVASGSLNLQVASIVFFYELPVALITYLQAMRRARRPGQKAKRVYFYYAIAKGTVEEKALESFRQGKSLLDLVLRGKVKLESLYEHR